MRRSGPAWGYRAKRRKKKYNRSSNDIPNPVWWFTRFRSTSHTSKLFPLYRDSIRGISGQSTFPTEILNRYRRGTNWVNYR